MREKMDSMQVSMVVVGLILVVGTHMGSAIKCVECNSKYEEFCDDMPEDFENKLDKVYLVDCSEKKGIPDKGHVNGKPFDKCRVMKQTVEGESRVIRMCAAHDEKARCYERTGTKNIKLSYCTCEGDYCNTAAGLFSTKILLLSLISAILALISYS